MFLPAPDFQSAEFGVAGIAWSLDSPAQANVSSWTGRRTVVADPWHRRWRARVDLCPVTGDSSIRTMRSFLTRCRGSVATFRLHATEGKQNDNVDVTVAATAAAGATSMTIAGAATPLKDGEFATVNGQLLQITRFQSGQTIAFEPPLRQQAAAGTPVVTSRPYALVHMAESTTGWSVEPGAVYGIGFNVEEAILEADGTAPESQLVTNGYFTTDTAGWTPISIASLSIAAARLRVTNSANGGAIAYQAINLTPFMSYRITADLLGGTSPMSALGVGTSPSDVSMVNLAGAGSKDATFVAATATVYISLHSSGASVTGQYNDYDNISMRAA